MLLVVANTVEVAQSFERWRTVGACAAVRCAAFRCIFAKVVDDGARRGEGVRVAVEAKAGEFSYAELLFQDALSIVVLVSPVINAAFDSAGSVEQGSLGGFKKLRGARQKSFAWMQELQFVTQRFFCKRAG